MIEKKFLDIDQPDVCYMGGMLRRIQVAQMAHDHGIPFTPHSANWSLVTLFTMHLLCAIPNPGKYLEYSIEGADYYPWQEGLYVQSPYKIKDGMIALPEGPGWGVEISPDWLSRATYQVSEVK